MRDFLSRIKTGVGGFFSSIWRMKAGRVLLVIAWLLMLSAIGVGIGLYLEGDMADNSAHQLLVEYEQAISSNAPAAPQGSQDTSQPGESQTTGPTAAPIPQSIGGYQVIGTLTLEKTAQTLPVISETSDKALKVSVCWFEGAMPGEKGNMVITGHDYASGAHFGQLSKLAVGDRVSFAAPDKTYVYEVYDTEIIKPDEPEKLNDYEGDTVLTMLTCTSHGNRRLVVRCQLVV